VGEKVFVDVAENRKAYHDFEILETIEAGIELRGTEIKSVREHAVNLKDSFVLIRDGEAFVLNLHISPYGHGNIFNHEPERKRKLLLHKKQILQLEAMIKQKNVTVVPTKMYIKGKVAKLLIGVAKGKKLHDKRDSIREKDVERDTQREMKSYR
jgi:SsrA-binding protein